MGFSCLGFYPKIFHFISRNFLTTFFMISALKYYPNSNVIIILHTPFISAYFITAQTAFHKCTFSFITAHFVNHCTLKQALALLVPSSCRSWLSL